MAQQQLIIPERDFSGSDLSELLEDYGKAEASGHIGTERPSYITRGGKWTRDNQDGSLSLMVSLGDGEDVEYDKIMSDGRATDLPKGGIIMWSGPIDKIPTGWALCDGQNGTPDLRGRFILGAHTTALPVGTKGGSSNATTSSSGSHAHSFSRSTSSSGSHTHLVNMWSNNHTLSSSQMPSHTHGVGIRVGYSGSSPFIYGYHSTPSAAALFSYTNTNSSVQPKSSASGSSGAHRHQIYGNTGSVGAHTHTVSGNTNTTGNHTHTVNVTPPYYALAFIIKL